MRDDEPTQLSLPRSARGRLKWAPHLGAFLLGAAVLGVLLYRVGWRDLADAAKAADPVLFVVALAFFVPQVVVTTWRWQLIGASARPLPFGAACRMVVAGSSLNVVLPSHLGDMCKGLMLGGEAGHGLAGGLGLAALDKLMDTLGLAAVLVVAGFFALPIPEAWVLAFWLAALAGVIVLVVLLYRARAVEPLPRRKPLAALARALNAAVAVRRRRAAWRGSLALSALLWGLHIGQIAVFCRAVGSATPPADVFLRVPIAILIGLLPITVAGIGTRDWALVLLLSPWNPRPVIVLVGLFCTLRYVVMALLGLPAIVTLGPTLASALRAARGGQGPQSDVVASSEPPRGP